MAEWTDVIHAIRRICVERHGQCAPCVLSEYACPNNVRFDQTNEAEFRKLEDFVVKWMAANPEPVYPTWRDLFEIMGANIRCDGTVQFQLLAADKPIPADIAQKLGLQPKEG